MGYSTDFDGQFNLDRPLTPPQIAYLRKFADTRRMKRDASLTALRPDPIREAVGLPVGEEGGYFVGALGGNGQERSEDILDWNGAPNGQPGLWCDWIPTDDGSAIEWNGGEKFYSYVSWIEYLIEHFLKPWGYTVNGEVDWEGEESDDFGKIVIVDNRVGMRVGEQSYAEVVWQ